MSKVKMNEAFSNYKIPEDVLLRIPKHFYPAFGGELVSIFGIDIFEKDTDNLRGLDFITGTTGWHSALRMTCSKLGMEWLYKYYNNLKWYESDMFDSELEGLLIDNFIEPRDPNTKAYYEYLTWRMG